MLVRIEIQTENAAFCRDFDGRHEPGPEIARILRRLADDYEGDKAPEKLYDANGNAVGRVQEWTS